MKNVIISNPYGQLCNRLVRLAHLSAFCLENKFSLIDVYFDEYSHYFEFFKEQKICSLLGDNSLSENELNDIKNTARNFLRFQSRFSGADEVLNSSFINKFFKSGKFYAQNKDTFDLCEADYMKKVFFSDENNIFLIGWLFLAPELIVKHREEILKIFRPLKEYVTKAEDIVKRARENCDILVGVHMRKGDFKESVRSSYHENDRYFEFMKKCKDLLSPKKVGFLICSNEKINKEDIMQIGGTVGAGNVMVDLHSLSLCDYIIGTASTFGQWASFYGNVPYFTLRDFTKYMELDDFKVHHCIFPDWVMDVVENAVANSGMGYEML